ncbi:MAG TPA: DUF948 domain-containing protein, partial [Rhabdochlamydiaceae bacterium]
MMFTEACLAIIAITLIVLLIVVIRISYRAQQSIHLLQVDVHTVSKEAAHLLNSLNEFVHRDLHSLSGETTRLISTLNDLSSDINHKSHALNFFFKPLSFLSSICSGSSKHESDSQSETIPQLLKWIASSAF